MNTHTLNLVFESDVLDGADLDDLVAVLRKGAESAGYTTRTSTRSTNIRVGIDAAP